MASRCLKLLRIIRNNGIVHRNLASAAKLESDKFTKIREPKIEKNLNYFGDPDTFGTLSKKFNLEEVTEEGDILEEQYIENAPLSSQKLTTRQYADLIKQYLSHKRLKEAIDILEVRMLKEDRVQPENYIYNILIGACADVGYTKKAFKLYNEMKRRALQPTGDTYTCLFQACVNSPFPSYGLKQAQHLRSFMIEKGVEPNITNYNSMIKAFGRCGDLPTAFQIVDEMMSKKIKIRVHTLNHLLQACIADKESGLRHALVVWRKMLKLREKPNIYSFNLMLKCVKECNLGSKEDIEQLLGVIQEHQALSAVKHAKIKMIAQNPKQIEGPKDDVILNSSENTQKYEVKSPASSKPEDVQTTSSKHDLSVIDSDRISLTFIDSVAKPMPSQRRTVPNLLSKVVNMNQVLTLQAVHTQQDKFAVLGGQEDFLKEMEEFSVKPDIKTFTQMLPLIEDTREAEMKLLDTMKNLEIKADIDFYNMLIKKRCMRSDYDGAFDVKNIIEEESKLRQKKYRLKKKLQLNMDVMSYGMLAMACRTKDKAEELLSELKEKQLKVNIEILGTLLRQGTAHSNFGYILYIMNLAKKENIRVNDFFLKHLEAFNDKCASIIQSKKKEDTFTKAYRNFSKMYSNWLKEVDIMEALKPEHPWAQFQEAYPDTVQRQNIKIKEPKRFYRKNKKKYVEYRPIK